MRKDEAALDASRLIDDSLVWDNHACMPLRAGDVEFLPQLDRFRQAGVDVVSLNVGFDTVPWENTVPLLATFRRWIRQHGDDYCLVEKVEDIDHARQNDLLAVTFDIEGGSALNGQLDMVELYYELGVRWMLIAYNQNNALGGGCQDDDQGLTAFGRRVIDEMARVGMVLCCSHTGHRSAMEAMEHSANPVIFSHSNSVELWRHKRNISDEAIKACAGTGGVVGINGFGIFLGDDDSLIEACVRHIDHVVQMVGPDHVGLGLDYVFDQAELDDYVIERPDVYPPEEGYGTGMRMVAPEDIPAIGSGLLRLGYGEPDLRAILGGNHLRIARRVWKPANQEFS